ncbi:ABC transporter substrate-binding protein [Tomitella gaofuii]|uniref:ABC transporter substrate-binding protein n=1 Tax=Tomitella gaofuii TaxID=2760083 RepID=UPI0015FBD4D0|nr:ABC transporter substrate-binding protein [Tomitella gaofuii]
MSLLISGCASNGGQSDPAVLDPSALSDGMFGEAGDVGAPVRGGTVSFASFSEPTSLDPAKAIAAATTGGVELLNIYDSLMRYDAESDTDVPQLAERLTHDDTFTTWTLTLRDGVTFSDGTPVDAAAVKASQQRFGAADGPDAAVWNANVADIASPDSMTVVYTLDRPWPQFSNSLTTGAGMIVAPAAGPTGEGFTPIGAGPFTLDSWAQGTSMTLAARPDYWAGTPYLDTVTMVYPKKTDVAKETFLNGEIDVVYLRNPDDITDIVAQGYPGYVGMAAVANVTIINAAPGRPGADPRVRKAIQMGLDSEALFERAFGTSTFSERELFGEYSRWHTDVGAVPADPAAARELVEQAKADGFDGRLVFDVGPNESSHRQALALQAQLQSVGFTVEVRRQSTGGDHIRAVAADRDYDIAEWGVNLRDPDPYVKMAAAMHSGGKQVYGMYTSPEMDALIDSFQSADQQEKLALMAEIQRRVNDDVPFVTHGYYPEYLAMQRNLHGVQGSSNAMVSFAQAWTS